MVGDGVNDVLSLKRSNLAIAMGSGGSKATLTVLDAAQVRLDLDTGGDGTVESTVTRPWTSLL